MTAVWVVRSEAWGDTDHAVERTKAAAEAKMAQMQRAGAEQRLGPLRVEERTTNHYGQGD